VAVELRGEISEDRWTMRILDNGSGFAEETIARVAERVSNRPKKSEGLAPMAISGMGLLNSYERLRLTFGERTLFSVGNRSGGGAEVVIGAERNG
jgi:sensor histidine kinase YesM